jgi:hypothetical protein
LGRSRGSGSGSGVPVQGGGGGGGDGWLCQNMARYVSASSMAKNRWCHIFHLLVKLLIRYVNEENKDVIDSTSHHSVIELVDSRIQSKDLHHKDLPSAVVAANEDFIAAVCRCSLEQCSIRIFFSDASIIDSIAAAA